MSTYQEMGKRIKHRRKEVMNIPQKALADELGLSQNSRTSIAKWEKGSSFPALEVLPQLSKILDCEIGYLFGEFDTPNRGTVSIEEETGLCFEAADLLRWFGDRNDEATQIRKKFIEDLLCSEHLYNLALAYKEYKEIFTCAEYAEYTKADDLVCLPSGKTFLAVEADREKDIALFRLQKAIIAFAEGKTKKSEK